MGFERKPFQQCEEAYDLHSTKLLNMHIYIHLIF